MKIIYAPDCCKTNPIKPNLVRRPVRRSFSEDGSLGEGGFKPSTSLSSFWLHLALGGAASRPFVLRSSTAAENGSEADIRAEESKNGGNEAV